MPARAGSPSPQREAVLAASHAPLLDGDDLAPGVEHADVDLAVERRLRLVAGAVGADLLRRYDEVDRRTVPSACRFAAALSARTS